MHDATNMPAPASARKDAWRGMGIELPEGCNAKQALKHAKLDNWNVRKVPTFTRIDHKDIPIPGRFAIVADSREVKGQVDVLGDVGDKFTIMQHEHMADVMDYMVKDAQATLSTAGLVGEGRGAFMTMKMPGAAKVGGSDMVDTYLGAITRHDGKASTTFMVTPVRRASQSTLNLSFAGASYIFRAKHTKGAKDAVKDYAKQALDFTYDYLDVFEAEAAKLANTKLTQANFERLITATFGAPAGAPAPTLTRTQNKLDHMAELFSDSHMTDIGGTAWAGLTAITEWFDHHSHVRPDGGSELAARSRKAIMEPLFKNDALAAIMELVK